MATRRPGDRGCLVVDAPTQRLMSAVLATAIGGILSALFILVLTALWRFAGSVTKNTEAIAQLATAVEEQHRRLARRIRKLERREDARRTG